MTLRSFFMGTYSSEVLADSPVRYWKLDDSTGVDTQGNGNLTKGASTAAPTTGVTGQSGIGTAWSFDGGDEATFTMPTISTTFTFELFFKSTAPSTKNAHTFLRFDGSDVGVIRMQGDAAAYPGEIYGVIGTAEFRTTTRYDDDAWHHLAVVVNGTSVKVYVDGVLKSNMTGGKTSYSFGSGYVGRSTDGVASERLIGSLDEIAIYNTALSEARVQAHYNNRATVNGGYTAQAATGSGEAVDPAVDALPHWFSTNFDNGVNPFTVSTTDIVSASSGDLVVGDTTQAIVSSRTTRLTFTKWPIQSGGEMLFKIGSIANNSSIKVVVGTSQINIISSANKYIRMRREGSDLKVRQWNVGGTEPTTWITTVGGWASDTTDQGLQIVNSSGSIAYVTITYFGARQTETVPNPDVVSVSYTATAATGTSAMPDPVISAVDTVSVSGGAMGGSASMPDPVITFTGERIIFADPAEGSGEGPLGGFSTPAELTAEVMEASGEFVDPTLEVFQNALIVPTPAQGNFNLIAPMLYINEVPVDINDADRYRQLLLATTDDMDLWYRLNESSGTVIHDARGDAAKNADIFGTYRMDEFGPESRRAFHFDNGYIRRRWLYENPNLENESERTQSRWDDADTTDFTFEVVLRTTQKDGVLAYAIDRSNPTVSVSPFGVPYFRNAITLKGGRVSLMFNIAYSTQGNSPWEFTGIKDVADGQWHHVVIAVNGGGEYSLTNGLRIYVDGKLDRRIARRSGAGVPGLFAVPDSFFGVPDAWRSGDGTNPFQMPANFIGDVMEVVYRRDAGYDPDTIEKLYYAAMGYYPIEAGAATGTGEMFDASGKGNRKRLLVLYTITGQPQGINAFGNIGMERESRTGLDINIPDEFDHGIAIGQFGTQEIAGFIVRAVPIMHEESYVVEDGAAHPYRDTVTDLPRLLNLQEDLDLEDYDVIAFRNWPDEGVEQEIFTRRGYTNAAVEDFLASVKQAVVDGISLEVTNPNLASRLGLISSAAPIPTLYEKANGNEFDRYSTDIDPWGLGKYMDTHANNIHRVVSTVEGLTDLADVEHMTELILTYNDGTNGEVNNKWAYKLSTGPLTIGMEIQDRVQFWNKIFNYTDTGPAGSAQWNNHVWAITPDGLRVGTPLYRFANNIWVGNQLVPNPYRDYIGAAVVQPGDVWGGQQIAGKVFLNFAEAPMSSLNVGTLPRQLVPANEGISNPLDWEDANKREWDYSYGRVQTISGATNLGLDQRNDTIITQLPDGSVSISYKRSGSLIGIEEYEKYPTEAVLVPTWAMRGWAWLAAQERAPEGSAVQRTVAATGEASMPHPTVRVEKNSAAVVEPALANGSMRNPEEVLDPDVQVMAFPATGFGSITGYGKTLSVDPFEGSGDLVDNFDQIAGGGEQVVVYLFNQNEINLYLLEDM